MTTSSERVCRDIRSARLRIDVVILRSRLWRPFKFHRVGAGCFAQRFRFDRRLTGKKRTVAFNLYRAVRTQLEACVASEDVQTIKMTGVDVHWLASDLTHAIVKRGCRDQDVIDLSERLDYVDGSGDGSLKGWYD